MGYFYEFTKYINYINWDTKQGFIVNDITIIQTCICKKKY